MKRLSLALAGAALAILAVAATASAAGPTPSPAGDQLRTRDTIPAVLGLSQAELMDLRQDGLTLAQIAERQNVAPQKLIDALVAQWTLRIDARVQNGGLTTRRGRRAEGAAHAAGDGDGQPGAARRDAWRSRRSRTGKRLRDAGRRRGRPQPDVCRHGHL